MAKNTIPGVRNTLGTLVAAVLGLIGVLGFGFLIRHQSAISVWDQGLLVGLNSAHQGYLDYATLVFNRAFAPLGSLVIVVGVVIIIAITTRRVGQAVFIGLTAGAIYAPVNLIKMVIQRPRPAPLPYVVPGTLGESSSSFPSGHTVMAAALMLTLYLVSTRRLHRWLAASFGILVVAATAFARMYVGAHYLTDVLASVVLVATVGPAIYRLFGFALGGARCRPDHANGKRGC
ncbi:MAG: phosphatase PAP2 family protein [Propionibacteriaceae bacterium]|nr:phosphatase PAP2 family protein [Propionibacteriaceae bacterium]